MLRILRRITRHCVKPIARPLGEAGLDRYVRQIFDTDTQYSGFARRRTGADQRQQPRATFAQRVGGAAAFDP